MHTKVAASQQVAGFERVLEALAQELIGSTDEELLEAAMDLGMDPTMRGSAAFMGLKYSDAMRLSDFFEVPTLDRQRLESAGGSIASPHSRRKIPARKTRPKATTRGGGDSDAE